MGKNNPFEHFYGGKSSFVYYNDLERTYKNIYDQLMRQKVSYMDNHNSHLQQIGNQMLSWAHTEAQKEIALLNEYFGGDLQLNENQLYDKNFAKQLINGLNTALQFKEEYERFLTRILGPEGKEGTAKITGAQFFGQYFSNNLYELAMDSFRQIVGNIESYSMEEIANRIYSENNINLALERALNDLKESGDWSGTDENQGYKEFLTAVENSAWKEGFAHQIYKNYRLYEIRDNLLKEIEDAKKIQNIFNSTKTNGKDLVKRTLKETNKMKGEMAEILGRAGMQAAAEALGVRMTSIVTGNYGGKSDITATVGINFSKNLSDIIERGYNDRAERVAAYKELSKKLKNLKEGFIIYTNAKEYSLVKNGADGKKAFSKYGFSAGGSIPLKSLEGVIKGTPGGSQFLIRDIMNTLEGAVFSELKPQIEEELAQKMAYFLFDDVTVIGREQNNSAKSIHLLLLDGIYIPLSFLFLAMGEALLEINEIIDGSPQDIFKVSISSGSIKWPYGTNNNPEDPYWYVGAWEEQRNIAFNEIKISAKFLRNFVDMLNSVL